MCVFRLLSGVLGVKIIFTRAELEKTEGAMSGAPTSPSAWAPLKRNTFTALWLAMLASNIGGWTHDVGAGWLMTTLNPSPMLVSLVQAATTLPVFLLALPAGALADILDRRRLLLFAKAGMALLALGISLTVLAGRITPAALLAFTFAMGLGTALVNPAWQAIVPQLVPREELASAVVLNSLGINVSRAIGPALGGVAIVSLGLAAPFLINAVSFLIVIGALYWWNPPAQPLQPLPAERLFAAMRAGVRYARASQPLKATLLRAVVFLVFASAYWALLPLIARQQLNGSARLYGVLVTCIGAGAVAGALALPALRCRYDAGRLVALSSVATSIVLCAFALATTPSLAVVVSLLAGATWITAVSSFNISAQMSLPNWVRARGLAVFSALFFGSLALGSTIWGQIAGFLGIPWALLISAGCLLLLTILSRRIPLQSGGELDLTPSAHWPQPVLYGPVENDRGPMMVIVEYRVDADRATSFFASLRLLEQARRRDGAFAWAVFRDAAEPGRFVESFWEESWLVHLRHHERVTAADRDVQAAVQAFHLGPEAPRVTHYVAVDLRAASTRSLPHADGELQCGSRSDSHLP
jgi:MFS family permease